MVREESIRWGLGLSALLIAVLLIHYKVLLIPAPRELYPWASDTLGHVAKAEYLQRVLAAGDLRPSLFPDWYLGLQIFRYYPPLPYYLLAGVTVLVGNPVLAANWFIVGCALAGAAAWLPYHRWLGWQLAVTGGILYTLLPDHVRVAFAEGNLPRVLATALLPVAFYLLLRALKDGATVRHRLALALVVTAIVLSHAMMAAIYGVTLALFAVLCCFGTRSDFRRLAQAGAASAGGILLAGWWLVPSLRGGITDLNAVAVADAQPVIPISQFLNPVTRIDNPEMVYIGAALLVFVIVLLVVRRGRSRHTVALTLTGLVCVLITVPGANDIFRSLPAHHLFWPTRFLGVASFLMLLALLWQIRSWSVPLIGLGLVMILLVAMDSAGSLGLIHLRPPRDDLVQVSRRLAHLDGWREATLDDSRLGSAATRYIARNGEREQVFGWAYQGARIARNLAALNEGLHAGFTTYLVDRLALYGVDDVLLLNDIPGAFRLAEALRTSGFRPAYGSDDVTLYHQDGIPRAYIYTQHVLGIGRGAQNFAYLFPEVKVGSSAYVDDYDRADLLAYDTLILSDFRWHNKPAAETLIQKVAAAGTTVVVDLTGVPENPLARTPRFLGVWGERIILPKHSLAIRYDNGRRDRLAFDAHDALWYTHTPQGMQVEKAEISYLGERASAFGYTPYGEGRVWFVGLNLAYHAVLTQDAAAIDLLGEVLHLSPTSTDYRSVQLQGYRAHHNGYRFAYRLATSRPLIVPIAHHNGTVVSVDGRPVATQSIENLIVFDAPAGTHDVSIRVEPTLTHTAGWIVTVLGALGLLALARTFDHDENSLGMSV